MMPKIAGILSQIVLAPRRAYEWYRRQSGYFRWILGVFLGTVLIIVPLSEAAAEYWLGHGLLEWAFGPKEAAQELTEITPGEQNVRDLITGRELERSLASQPETYIVGVGSAELDEHGDSWQIRARIVPPSSFTCEISRSYPYGQVALKARNVYFSDEEDFSPLLVLIVNHRDIPKDFAEVVVRFRTDQTRLLRTAKLSNRRLIMDVDDIMKYELRERKYFRISLLPVAEDDSFGAPTIHRAIELNSKFDLNGSKRALRALEACGKFPTVILDGLYYRLG